MSLARSIAVVEALRRAGKLPPMRQERHSWFATFVVLALFAAAIASVWALL